MKWLPHSIRWRMHLWHGLLLLLVLPMMAYTHFEAKAQQRAKDSA